MENNFERPYVAYGVYKNHFGIKFSGDDKWFCVMDYEGEKVDEVLKGFWTHEYAKDFRSAAGACGYLIKNGLVTGKELKRELQRNFPSEFKNLETFFEAIERK